MSLAHTVEPDYGTGKKKLSVYIIGIVLCIILTLIPFATVMYHLFARGVTFFIVFSSAILQFLVQVTCFLRLNTATEQGKMNVMSIIFAIIILLVIVVGSLWIMWNLNYNMMH